MYNFNGKIESILKHGLRAIKMYSMNGKRAVS